MKTLLLLFTFFAANANAIDFGTLSCTIETPAGSFESDLVPLSQENTHTPARARIESPDHYTCTAVGMIFPTDDGKVVGNIREIRLSMPDGSRMTSFGYGNPDRSNQILLATNAANTEQYSCGCEIKIPQP